MSQPKDRIKLVRPRDSDEQAVIEYRDEFLDAGETIHGSGGLERFSTFEEWLKNCIASENQETLPKDRVPATQYLAVRESDGRLVGMIQIRHCLNEHLRLEGGHIGYSVRRSERRKGYATQMLRAALNACPGLGIKEALVTCEPNNIGSAGVIKANGGVYKRQVRLGNGERLDHYLITIS
jgi:predicted acetyltransferase